MCKSPQNCKRYFLEFDLNYTDTMNQNATDTVYLSGGFTNNPVDHYSIPVLDSPFDFKQKVSRYTWLHMSIPFYYCSGTNNKYFVLSTHYPSNFYMYYIDNLSVTEDLSPPPFSVNVSPSNTVLAIGNSTTLYAIPADPYCSLACLWQPGSLSGDSIIVSPMVTTTYTLYASDGCSHYDTATATVVVSPLSVNPARASDNLFKAYPNPAGNELTVEFTADALKESSIAILDVMGQTVLKQKIKDKKEIIELTGIESGVYFVEVQTRTEKLTKKIIVFH
jgi:hypothetical protein